MDVAAAPVGGWTDTHCHIHDDRMSSAPSETLMRAREAGVTALVVVGTDARTCAEVTTLAAAHDDVWATVGLHPHDAVDGVDTVVPFLDSPRVVAVGECGLDYHYDHSPRPVQMRAFAEQIRLAHERDLSLVVHTRDAWDDTLDVLAVEGVPSSTIIHCFTGGPAEAERCLAVGAYLSFSGIVTFKNAADIREAAVACPADRILVAVGRKANTTGLGAAEAGLRLDDRGRIVIDDHYRTNLPGVHAIGDVVAGPMLAHKAEEEGVAVAELIAGKAGHVNYGAIPGVIYTEPEVANVGLSETEAQAKGIEVRVGKFALQANGRAIATDATAGLVKVVACARTDKVLGVQMVAKGASEMIAAACAHLEYGGSAEDIARTCFAHPTLSESFKEAAMAVSKSSIHSL